MIKVMSMSYRHLSSTFNTWEARVRYTAHYLYTLLLQPRSVREDDKRRERILTIVLFGIVVLSVLFQITLIIEWLRTPTTFIGVSPYIHGGFLVFYTTLFVATRKGYYRPVAYIFLAMFFVFTSYASYRWGASLPMALLSYALLISMASIVISSRFGLIMAFLVCASIGISGYHEHVNQINPEWKKGVIEIHDIVEYSIMLLVGTFLSWLYTREIERSLKRARFSEQALKEERDNLEVLVEARTKALKQAERERITQLYRFAEFGKLSAGIFHDLLNPLTAVSLSVSKLSDEQSHEASANLRQSITTAVQATKRMDQFMGIVKKQIKSDELINRFSVNNEIEDVIELLTYHAHQAGIQIIFNAEQEVFLENNPFKFNQVATNLIGNAVEAYTQGGEYKDKIIVINLTTSSDSVIFRVHDKGIGITPDTSAHIFEPFFTTKNKGIGLGLSTTKDIIEKNFGGTITYTSDTQNGTTFTIHLPLHGSNITSPH